jgi:hypothetical protein
MTVSVGLVVVDSVERRPTVEPAAESRPLRSIKVPSAATSNKARAKMPLLAETFFMVGPRLVFGS